jgi:hypothetical protein
MARITPDPSFYPTATDASAAAPEKLAYVANIGVGDNGDTPPDALGVLDQNASSSSYGQIVNRVESRTWASLRPRSSSFVSTSSPTADSAAPRLCACSPTRGYDPEKPSR